MQMSVFLALVQTFLAAASLGVALFALDSGDPPHSDGSHYFVSIFLLVIDCPTFCLDNL